MSPLLHKHCFVQSGMATRVVPPTVLERSRASFSHKLFIHNPSVKHDGEKNVDQGDLTGEILDDSDKDSAPRWQVPSSSPLKLT